MTSIELIAYICNVLMYPKNIAIAMELTAL